MLEKAKDTRCNHKVQYFVYVFLQSGWLNRYEERVYDCFIRFFMAIYLLYIVFTIQVKEKRAVCMYTYKKYFSTPKFQLR